MRCNTHLLQAPHSSDSVGRIASGQAPRGHAAPHDKYICGHLALARSRACAACRYLAVAEPGLEALTPDDLRLFKVRFGEFVKLHEGTWHAGPHFEGLDHMDFYNLELADTNQADHHNHHFDRDNGVEIKILPC